METVKVEITFYKDTGKWYTDDVYHLPESIDFTDNQAITTALEKCKGFIKGMNYTFNIDQGGIWNKRLVII